MALRRRGDGARLRRFLLGAAAGDGKRAADRPGDRIECFALVPAVEALVGPRAQHEQAALGLARMLGDTAGLGKGWSDTWTARKNRFPTCPLMDNRPIRVLFSEEPRIMSQLANATPLRACRHDGWTEARRTRFLEVLVATANVRLACGAVGLSRQAAYNLQRRDPEFAAAWRAALRQARDEATRAFLEMLPEFLLRTLSDSSTPCKLQP